MPDGVGVQLAYVVTTEGLRSVASYRGRARLRNSVASPRAVLCPVCDEPVTMRLGPLRAAHAAHAPSARCPTTQPETALHVNLKCRIAEQLRGIAGTGARIRVHERCVVGAWRRPAATRRVDAPIDQLLDWERDAEPCRQHQDRVWDIAWDRVELERRVADEAVSRIPDIVLYLSDRVVAAIEVFHTHAVDATKAEALASLGVPWLEVRADVALLEGDAAWTVTLPLPAHRVGPDDSWRCPKHARWYARDVAQLQRVREQAPESTRLCGVRLVDFYSPSGHQFRRVYQLVEHRREGAPITMHLEHDKGSVYSHRVSSDRAEVNAALKRAFQRDIRLTTQKLGAIHDSPMRWAAGDVAVNLLAESKRPGRYLRRTRGVPCATTHPPRYQYLPQLGTWHLPPGHDVRWDRAGDDLVAAALDGVQRGSRDHLTTTDP